MYFLREYEQEVVHLADCLTRWFEFVGVDTDRAWEDTEYEIFTWED